MHIKFHLFLPEQLENIPKDLLNIGNTKQRVDNSKLLWDKPHKLVCKHNYMSQEVWRANIVRLNFAGNYFPSYVKLKLMYRKIGQCFLPKISKPPYSHSHYNSVLEWLL